MSASPESPRLREYQAGFAARIRDPRGRPCPPGVPARRMRVYEALLFNNLEGFLLACYPVTRKLLGTRIWRRLVRRFFGEYRCASPLFRDIPGAFLDWVRSTDPDAFVARNYLHDLLHYEWLELAVATDPAEPDPIDTCTHATDSLNAIPVINPTARLVAYRYPVHRIGPRYRDTGAAAHWYLVYRDDRDAVRFMVLSPVTARLLELIRDDELTGHAALSRVAAETNHPRPDDLIAAGQTLLDNLRLAGALTVARKPT